MVENKDDQNIPETNDTETSTIRTGLENVPGTLGEFLDKGNEYIASSDVPCLCD